MSERRYPSWRIVLDVVLTLVFTVAAFEEGLSHASTGYLGAAPPIVSAIVGACGALPLLARRRYPIRALIATELVMVVPHVFASIDVLFVGGIVLLGVQVASVAYFRRLPWNLIGLAASLPAFAIFGVIIPGFAVFSEIVFDVVVMVLAFGIGSLFALASQRNAALRRELAAQRETAELRAAAAVAEERAAIARELHDVIAHCVSVMVVQAGSARVQYPTKPDASVQALANIESSGREALTELRRVLNVLHTDARDDGPVPGFDRVDHLIEVLRSAGLEVALTTVGDHATLTAALDQSAYRILQESLTNALKHGGPGRADVRICYFDDRLEIDVENAISSVSRRAAPSGGNGLAGMKERVRAFSGQLSAEAHGDVFRVHAVLPLGLAAA